MSFQTGAFYFDQRKVPERVAGGVLSGAAGGDYDPVTSYSSPGMLLAHAAVELDGQIPDGPQPSIAQTNAITFDGRLDNRDDLLLRLRDFLRGATSDAAVALATYGRWGSEGLVHLIGDWSLVIWDTTQKAVVLASDFAGVRPLYYCLQPNRFLWSTDLGSLADVAEAHEIDDEYAAGLLSCGGCPNRTPYAGVHSVPPGHSVVVTRDETKIQPFWKPPIGNTIRYRHESDYETQLRALFREAIQCRLHTTAPVLSQLSGGFDSSSIVCMASYLMRSGEAKAPRFVTLSYEHQGSRDTPFYSAVEEFCQVESIHVSTDDFQFLTETQTGGAVPAFWEPLHIQAAKLARQTGAKTYCTGQLGDLIMGNWDDDTDQVSALLRRGRLGPALREALAWSKVLRIPISWVLWKAFLSSLPPLLATPRSYQVADQSGISKSSEDSLQPGFRKRMSLSDPHRFFSAEWMGAPPDRRKHVRGLMEILQLRKLQPPEPLQHLYYTHPYAHRPLVTFLLSIPPDVLCRAGEPRRLMRRAFHELWPPMLRKRRSKDAFGGVFLNSLRPLATQMLKEPQRLRVVERGYVDAESVKRRLEQLIHSLGCNEPQLRQLILLEFWLRAHEGTPHGRISSRGQSGALTAEQPITATR